MRKLVDEELNNILVLTENSLNFALIEPTLNGLKKSILDATGPVRTFLKNAGFHDYNHQKKGQENKVLLPTLILTDISSIRSIASLYRPETKEGDPRIWFSNLKYLSDPSDIIAIIEYNSELVLINISKFNLKTLLQATLSNPIKDLISEISNSSLQVSKELLRIMQKISDIGLIPADLDGNTSIGRTLENLLGIAINSSKLPDYKGIEIKSFRNRNRNRKNLFAQVPAWNLSKFKSSSEVLTAFGYRRGDYLKLYCTVSGVRKNSQGLMLRIENKLDQLIEFSENPKIGEFVIWPLETLHARLLEKHNETFWISTDSVFIDGKEYFEYKEIEHTQKPIISQFDILIEQGAITVDHLIKKDPSGKVIEKGPLFKLKSDGLGLLFPPSQKYNLSKK